MRKILFIVFVTCLAFVAPVFAGGEKDSTEINLKRQMKFIDSVEKAMKYETDKIIIGSGITNLNIPKGFKFLNNEQSNYVLSTLWGNPPQKDILGIIFPENGGPFAEHSYAFIITFDEMGYVKDEDADKINYDDLLKQIQKEEVEENVARKKEGYGSIHMEGWASKPYYDKNNKVLHWAKNLQFENQEDGNTLNYEVRILGRKGVLSMNAVASMSDLDSVKKDIDKVLSIPSFTTGNTYKDFDSKTDNIAAWTIGGLVAGKVLLKVGFWAVLAKFFIAGWKFILIGLVAVGAFIKKFFGKKTDAPIAEVES
jgi:uncharacterized membrane-anchored protein